MSLIARPWPEAQMSHKAAADTTIPKSCAEEEEAKREPKAEENK
jgi:hypothetical protein